MRPDRRPPTGSFLQSNVIGFMKLNAEGGTNEKIVAVPADDRMTGNAINTLEDIPKQKIDQITHHFTHYKDLKKPGSTIVKGWGNIDEAKATIHEAIERWNNQ